MNDVVAYLEAKGIELHPASAGNVRTTCWWHGEEGEAKTGRLYIQADPEHAAWGQWFCHVCEEKGTFNRIKHHFGDAPDKDRIPQGNRLRVLSAAAQYYHEQLVTTEEVDGELTLKIHNDDVWNYLTQKRGLSTDAILRFKIGVADYKLNEFLMLNEYKREDVAATGLVWDTGKDFFQAGSITIPYFVQGVCAQIRCRDQEAVKNKYKTPPGQDPIPFNVDVVLEDNLSFVVLTEGEFDAMLLEDLGYNAIGIPGANAFKEDWVRAFADIRKVFICFDTDALNSHGHRPGQQGAEKIAGWLGGKARIVTLPDPPLGEKKVDVTDYFIEYGYKTEDFDQLIRKASSGQLVSVMDAFEMWTEREGNQGLTGVELGIDRLDTAIRPGILPGQVMVMLARTGSGKTITAINIMQRMIKMEPERTKILFVSLEQTQNEWFERARRIHGFYNPHLIPGRDLEMSTVDFYKDNFMMMDKNRVSPESLRSNIRQAEDELEGELSMVVVDYLGYWARAFKGEPYVRTSEAIMTMKEIAKEMAVPIYAPHQVNRGSEPGKAIKLNDARESGVIEETADFALSLLNDMNNPGVNPKEATGEIRLEFLKSRHGGVGVSAELRFAPVSLALVPMHDTVYGDEELRRAQDELLLWKRNHFDYTEVLRRHREGDRSFAP
jgi:archaellum biogenesis ATPase FlaH